MKLIGKYTLPAFISQRKSVKKQDVREFVEFVDHILVVAAALRDSPEAREAPTKTGLRLICFIVDVVRCRDCIIIIFRFVV